MNAIYRFTFCLLLLGCFGPAAWAEEELDFLDDEFYESVAEEEAVPDPFESFNRTMFIFNDYSYTWVLEPVASGYSEILPQDIRQAANNFFYNLQEPIRFVNTLLQLRFADAGTVLARFTINTLGGVGGLGDPAGRELGFKPVEAGMGETLDCWGVGDGFYLVVPFFGPTTLRDFSGSVIDSLSIDSLSMTPYYFFADSFEESFGIYMGKELNNLSLHLGEYESMKQLSVDPYSALRDGYFQRRKQARKHFTPLDDKI